MSSSPDKRCAYCGKAARAPEHAPFCSQGCRDRDLLQWLGEGYSVPVDADEAQALDKGDDDGLDAPLRAG
jgi:endogenous inhibitor of DNA gyrase (YacG/DUF329 family)